MNTSVDFTSFTQAILNNIQNDLGRNYTVFTKIIRKNNGTNKTGVIIKEEGQSTYPAIYIDELYRKGLTPEDIRGISDGLLENFQKAHLAEKVDLSGFIEFELAREKLAYKLINAEKNRELLREVPHKMFHNLALVFFYSLQESPFYGKAAILVHNRHMKQWGSDTGELCRIALENTPKLFPWVLDSMEKVLQDILAESLGWKKEAQVQKEPGNGMEKKIPEERQDDELSEQMQKDRDRGKLPMYVLTNRQNLYGAACMLYPGVIRDFAVKAGGDFYILPSSVHEVILVPADSCTDQQALIEIVTDINRTQVAADEVLADSVYYYSRKEDRILWIL